MSRTSKNTKRKRLAVRQRPEFTAALVAFRMQYGYEMGPENQKQVVANLLSGRDPMWMLIFYDPNAYTPVRWISANPSFQNLPKQVTVSAEP